MIAKPLLHPPPGLTAVAAAGRRVYTDFFLPSRLDELRQLIRHGQSRGYTFVSHERFWSLVTTDGLDPSGRYLLLRHDVDTDPGTARMMHEVEHRLGVVGTYYFRLSTLDPKLMRMLASRGNSVGYHYEELATLAKRRGRAAPTDWQQLLPAARTMFLRNLGSLRTKTGLPLEIVASHGDFVNRRLGVVNAVLLEDEEVRSQGRIVLEAYDDALQGRVSSRHADGLWPSVWQDGGSPLTSFDRLEPVVEILMHPRSWRADPWVNLQDDIRRGYEGLCFRLGLASGRSDHRRDRP